MASIYHSMQTTAQHRRTARRLAAAGLSLALLLALGAGTGYAQSPTPLEYKVKGAFLLNFAKFVKWPAGAFASADSPIVIGIAGPDPFGPVLDQLVSGETIGGRPILVTRLQPRDDPARCQLLFVARQADAAGLLQRVDGAPVLTVGETDDFADDGGIIRLLIENNKVRFEVNRAAAQRARLAISSQLLKLARKIKS